MSEGMRKLLGSRASKAGAALGLSCAVGTGVASLIAGVPLHPGVLLPAAAGVGLAGYAAVRWSLGPLALFVDQAHTMAKAQFDGERLEWSSPDEYQPLADAFDELRIGLRLYAGRIARRAIEFEGTLEVLDLATLLRLVRAGKRTGALVVQRSGETGVVFWRDGEIVGAALGAKEGREALRRLFQWNKGYFKFSPRLEPVGNLAGERWESLLLDGARSVDDPSLWARAIPRDESTPRRARAADRIPLRQLLTYEEWHLFNAIDGNRTVLDLAQVLHWPVAQVRQRLYALMAIGSVECDDALEFGRYLSEEPGRDQVEMRAGRAGGAQGKVIPIHVARRTAK